MSKEKIDVALKGGDVDKPKRNVAFGIVKSSYYKWPNGVVPYVLSDSVSKCKFIFFELSFLFAFFVTLTS